MNPVTRFFGAVRSLFRAGQKANSARTAPCDRAGARRSDFAFDPLDPDYVTDPYPLLSQLQDFEPIHRSPNGTWVLTRYEDVLAALSDRRLGNSPSLYAVVNERNRERYTCADVANNIIPFLDAPAHTRPRKLLSKAFLEFTRDSSADVENLAHSMVGEFKGKGAMDILDDFATPFSVRVLSRVLGVPPQDEPQLKEWSEDFFYLFSIIPSREIRENLDSTLREFRAYFKSLVEQRRKKPENDLISVLLHTGQEGERLSESEIIDHCMLLFADGVENVDSGIANAMHALLTHPGQLALLQAKPELMAQAVEECLRFETPGQFIGRMALEDFTLNGVSIKKNTGVLLVIGAANRDPRIFDDPHSLNIMRSPNPYLSFGKGRHACIGGPLVRIEMEAALRALIGTLQGISLSGTEIHWEARLGHRWIARLPVVFSRF